MTDDELLRYSRHILLDEIGIEGQQRLRRARALVIGAGGLGSPVALYLASAGIGRLVIVDPDVVDATNLQRQLAHTHDRIGTPKVESMRAALLALDPTFDVHVHPCRADAGNLPGWVAEADVVIDCSDNFATRQAVNAACVAAAVPLVTGAAIAFDGQVTVHDVRHPEAPCYACVFPPDAAPPRCAARRSASSRRSWASSDRCRRPRRSSCWPRWEPRSRGACRCSTRARCAGARFASRATPPAPCAPERCAR